MGLSDGTRQWIDQRDIGHAKEGKRGEQKLAIRYESWHGRIPSDEVIVVQGIEYQGRVMLGVVGTSRRVDA